MNAIMTIQEIETQFDAEWVLIENPQTDKVLDVQGGIVRYHSKDRDEVYQQAIALRPQRFATVFTGVIPEDPAIIL